MYDYHHYNTDTNLVEESPVESNLLAPTLEADVQRHIWRRHEA